MGVEKRAVVIAMGLDLLIALGLPLALVLIVTVVLANHQGPLPGWIQRLSPRDAMLWNIGIGLIIALSALRYVLSK
jgi:hypothetical protein